MKKSNSSGRWKNLYPYHLPAGYTPQDYELPHVWLGSPNLYLALVSRATSGRSPSLVGLTKASYKSVLRKSKHGGNDFIIVSVATHRGRVSLNTSYQVRIERCYI